MTSPLSDEDLVRGTLAGDEDAFSQLYDRYRVPVYSTAFRIIQDMEAAKDVIQEIFFKLYRSLPGWNPKKSRFATWLYRLAVNHAIDCWRSRRIRAESQMPDDSGEAEQLYRESVLAEAFHSPYQQAESRERIDQIRHCVDSLPDLQKRVFIMRFFQDLKLEEIAEMEECNLGTVKTSLFRATQALRRRLRRAGGNP